MQVQFIFTADSGLYGITAQHQIQLGVGRIDVRQNEKHPYNED